MDSESTPNLFPIGSTQCAGVGVYGSGVGSGPGTILRIFGVPGGGGGGAGGAGGWPGRPWPPTHWEPAAGLPQCDGCPPGFCMTQHRAVVTVSAVFQFQTEQVASAQQAAWHCAAVVSGCPILSVALEESPQHSVPFRLVGNVQAGGATGAAPAEETEAATVTTAIPESAATIITAGPSPGPPAGDGGSARQRAPLRALIVIRPRTKF